MGIRRTTDAFGTYPRVDGSCKIGIFHKAGGLARIVRKILVLAGGLNPTFVHPKNEGVRPVFFEGLNVDSGVNPESKRSL